ncbi:uncharacterized protein LOC143912806 [Arctopsyche grandis]|uniref:uncharacterized protein LOC143912806 n=1 Tax=Arctopsyche grandis TaxID=121162 RepID=UPI00406D71B8
MNTRRYSAQRLSEILLPNVQGRPSRVDQAKQSHIPRFQNQSGSLDRMSGVNFLDSIQHSATRGISRLPSSQFRNRSVDSNRHTLNPPRPKMESLHRPTIHARSRSGGFSTRETPKSLLTPSIANHLITPMSDKSTMSASSVRRNHQRTPSNECPTTARKVLRSTITRNPTKEKRGETDLNWQKMKGQEILSKFRSDPDISSILPSVSSPLRPITIKLFVDITNVLLSKLRDRNPLDVNDYVKRLPDIARELAYPGIVAQSWLKSVNAIHNYPYMLTFYSYLIDMIELKNSVEDKMSLEHLYGEDGYFYILRHQYYFHSWGAFQEPDFQDFDSIADEYISKLHEARGISDEQIQAMKANIEEREKIFNQLTEDVNKVHQKEKNMHTEFMSVKNRSDRLKEMEGEITDQIRVANEKAISEENSMKHIMNKMQDMQNQGKTLQEQLACQKMSIKERDAIIKETNYMNECLHTQQDLLNEMEKTSFEMDIELATEQKLALKASIAVNKYLVDVSLAAGKDLGNFAIRERDLLMKDTPVIIEKTIDELKNMKLDAETQLQKVRQEKISEASHKQHLKKEIETHTDYVNSLEKKLLELQQQTKAVELAVCHIKNLRDNIHLKVKENEESRIKNETLYVNMKKQLDHWKDQQQKWIDHVEKLKNEGQLVHETCKKQMEKIITELIYEARRIIPNVP